MFTVSRFVTGWTVVESGKHIWLYNSDLCQLVKSVWFVCQWFWNRFNWPTSGCAWSWIGVVSSWIVGLVWGTNFDPVFSPVQPQYNSKQNLLSLRAARRWPVVYAGPYDKTSPLAVSILFNENVLILFNLLFGSISMYECNFNWFVLVVSPLSVITTFIFYSQYTNDVGKALQR